MPTLTIIAEPNGAGKSTHSKELLGHLGIEAFDFDKEFYSIWASFDFDPLVEQGAFDRANELYLERRLFAIAQKQNFSFETNYHTKEIIEVINLFKSSDYRVELIFICLENVSLAIDRVKDRVAKGGHFVDELTIKERFEKGITHLDQTYDLFDMVSIYKSKTNRVVALCILEPEHLKFVGFEKMSIQLLSQLPNISRFIENNKS